MKKTIFILGLLAILIFSVSCAKTPTGAVVEEMETVVKEVSVHESGDDWCLAGSDWKMSSDDTSASWKVKELVASGKYAGLCHVVYTMSAGGETTKMDYYFDKEGKSGYVEITLPNGQVSVQEWHS